MGKKKNKKKNTINLAAPPTTEENNFAELDASKAIAAPEDGAANVPVCKAP